jgi:hypothetical protein
LADPAICIRETVAARSGPFDFLEKAWSSRTRPAMQALQNGYTGINLAINERLQAA